MKSVMPGRAAFAIAVWIAVAAGPAAASAQMIYHYKDQSGTVHLSDIKANNEYRPFFYFKLSPKLDRAMIGAIIAREAARQGIDPELVAAMVEVESGFKVRAVSPKGAQGLMQIMPGTAKDLKLHDSFDAARNIEAGTRYLRQLLDRFGGNVKLALAAYNAGPGTVSRCGGVPDIPETKKYIEKIRHRYGKSI